jgi:hypothetical protein
MEGNQFSASEIPADQGNGDNRMGFPVRTEEKGAKEDSDKRNGGVNATDTQYNA